MWSIYNINTLNLTFYENGDIKHFEMNISYVNEDISFKKIVKKTKNSSKIWKSNLESSIWEYTLV